MKDTPKQFYLATLAATQFDVDAVQLKFEKLRIDESKYDLFRTKSAILFLARFEAEIDSIVEQANQDIMSILNAATVKDERGRK
jgi:hypothetical protein